MKKLNALIIFGGMSNEYYVSRRSATSVLENIDKEKYVPYVIGITNKGEWYLYEGDTKNILDDTWMNNAKPAFLSPDRKTKGIVVLNNGKYEIISIDVIFPVVHGQNCEDGVLQGIMELSGIPYVGPKVTAAATTFDKEITHMIAERHNIKMAKWVSARKYETVDEIDKKIQNTIGYPCFMKPANSGSSVGCSPVKEKKDLKKALEIAFKEDTKVVIEEMILAHEVECAVMGNEDLFAPTTGEIVSDNGFYDFDSKYLNDSAGLFIPAKIPEAVTKQICEEAKKIYKVLDCKGLSRVDFFVKEDNTIIFNEINILPGFTSISMFPKMMIAGGYSYKDLITKLLNLAMEA